MLPGSSLGRHLESGVDPGNEVGPFHDLCGSLVKENQYV